MKKKPANSFDQINDALFADAEKANRYANMLMPVLNNIGNVLYVIVALIGGTLAVGKCSNVSISGWRSASVLWFRF